MHVVHPVRLPIKWLTCMYKRRKVAVFFSRLMYWQLLYSQVGYSWFPLATTGKFTEYIVIQSLVSLEGIIQLILI